MTASTSTSRRRPLVVVGALVILAVAVAGIWYLFFRPSGPAPVALGTAAPVTQAPAATPGEPGASPATAATPGASVAQASGDLSGVWTTDPSVGSFSDFSSSFAGYRVQETLANIGATEAVGRTPDVTGSILIDGTTITEGSFTADLTTLQSDERFRDGQLRRQALETDRFPTATFTLTKPVDLGAIPAEGATVNVTATGDLELHGVTKSVDVPLQARLQGGVVTIAGSLPVVFADYDIAKPQSMVVLSVADNGVMEVQLQLTKGLG